MPQPYEKASLPSKKQIIINNFLGGIFWSLGATLGLALIFALLTIVSRNIDFVPFIGEFVANIIDFVVSKNPDLRQ